MKMVEQPSVNPELPISDLKAAFGSKLEFDRELAPLTSFKTGGRARYFIAVSSADEICRAVRAARNLRLSYFLLGGGSNLLVSDFGYDGVIIKLDVVGVKLLPDNVIECGAGEDLMSLVRFAADNSLTGLEFAAGIKGSVGGAIYGNAGAFGGEIGSVIIDLTLVAEDGTIKEIGPEYCRFEYRDSYLKVTREVVVSGRFKLEAGNRDKITAKIEEILAMREERHPTDGMSAGSFFKNIPDSREPHGKLPAGRLLEQVGAKGMTIGGAQVYNKHANIIVNTGNATSKDIRDLADILKKKVFDEFGIMLQEEVQQLGRF